MKPVTKVAIAVFTIVSIIQFVRFAQGWEVVMNGTVVPLWASALAGTVAGLLAYFLWQENRRPRWF